jgi:hypothetical protein
MLHLRLSPRSTWHLKSPVPHILGTAAAAIFTVTNAIPLITIWIADPAQKYVAHSDGKVPWFAPQTMAISVLAGAGGYWLGWRFYLWQRRVRRGEVLVVGRSPVFWGGEGNGGEGAKGGGGLVQLYEIVRLQWRAWVPEWELEGQGGGEAVDGGY